MVKIRTRVAFPLFDRRRVELVTPPAVLTATHWIDGLDPGWSSPCVMLRMALLEPLHVHVCAEIVVTHRTVAQLLEISDALPLPASSIVGADHCVHTCEQTSGTSIAKLLQAAGKKVIAPYGAIDHRLRLLHGHLFPQPGRRRCTIDPRCAVLLRSLELYAGFHQRKNTWVCTTKQHTHSVDALCYGLIATETVDRLPDQADDVAVVSGKA